MDQDEAKEQAKNKTQQLKEKIPQKHRDAINDGVQSAKDVVTDAFPQERRDQFIYRLKKVS